MRKWPELIFDVLEIIATWPTRQRECLYYLAVGHYRLGNYTKALKHVDELLQMEPGNQQAISLRHLINSKANRGNCSSQAGNIH